MEGIVCSTDCKANLWFVILGYINKIDLTRLDSTKLVSRLWWAWNNLIFIWLQHSHILSSLFSCMGVQYNLQCRINHAAIRKCRKILFYCYNSHDLILQKTDRVLYNIIWSSTTIKLQPQHLNKHVSDTVSEPYKPHKGDVYYRDTVLGCIILKAVSLLDIVHECFLLVFCYHSDGNCVAALQAVWDTTESTCWPGKVRCSKEHWNAHMYSRWDSRCSHSWSSAGEDVFILLILSITLSLSVFMVCFAC